MHQRKRGAAMKLRTTIAAAVGAGLWGAAAALVISWAPAPAGAAPSAECNPGNPQTCDAGAHAPTTKVRVDLSGEVKARAESKPLMCPYPPREDQEANWINVGPDEKGHYLDREMEGLVPPHPGDQMWYAWCPYHINGWQNGVNLVGGGWSGTGRPPPQPPSAATMRIELWALVQGLLHNPAVSLDPAVNWRSLVNTPTFVAINNPQPSTLYTATVGNVFVWIAVVPHNTLHPGEPGAPAVPCDEDGTAYIRNGPKVRAQYEAANGCVYIYKRKSAGWNGNVTINWAVTWGSNQAGQNGTLTANPNVGNFNRIVGESQGVVTKAGS
jgi:hypothetical protein